MKANKLLDQLDVDYDLVVQDNPTKDCDNAAKERGVETSQIVKSLIIDRNKEKGRTENSERFQVLIPGDREVSEKKFGENRMVPPEKSKEITGFERGTVHPFSTEITHIVDYRLLEKDKVSFTIGQTNEGVILDKSSFEKALEKADFNYEVKDIALHNSQDVNKLAEKGLEVEEAKFLLRNGLTLFFKTLNSDHSPKNIFKVLKELEREENDYNTEDIEKILEQMQNETHMQKIVQEFSKTGKIPESQDEFDLENVVKKILESNEEATKDIKNGKDSAINYLIGKVMEKTKGKAEPEKTRETIMSQIKQI